MAKNETMHKAKKAKSDEFYTQYRDISSEFSNYRIHFRDKIIYCNCDDPTWSNFWRFFHNNFKSLGLKKLIATHYAEGEQESYALIYEGGDDFHMEVGEVIPIHADEGYPEKENSYCGGDFRSKDCIRLLQEADVICTNPPFSLFREYIHQLIEYNKSFIILGNPNAITYKEVFPLIKDNLIWIGYKSMGTDMYFHVPDDYKKWLLENKKEGSGYKIIDGEVMGRTQAIFFTNLDIKKRHDGLWHIGGKFDQTKAHRYYEGFEWYYKKYDNYDAINVDKVKEIPIDYSGVMGVPITWLDKYNPDEFNIIGLSASWDETEETKKLKTSSIKRHNPIIQEKEIYRRIFIQNKNPINKSEDKGY